MRNLAARILLLVCLVLVSTGCKSTPKHTVWSIEGIGEAPIKSNPAAVAPAKSGKSFPWDDADLISSATRDYSETKAITPGIARASSLLSARDEARLALVKLIEELPATADHTIGEFGKQNEEVARAVSVAVETARETVETEPDTGRMSLELALNPRPLAGVLERAGAGFDSLRQVDSANSLESDRFAQVEALELARQDVMRQMVALPWKPKVKLGDRIQKDAVFSEFIQMKLRGARVLESGKVGNTRWRTRVQVDMTPIYEYADSTPFPPEPVKK